MEDFASQTVATPRGCGYAEALGKEIGFFQDPALDYGRLNLELMRAVRLVVGTGIHSEGWTREHAVATSAKVDLFPKPIAPISVKEVSRKLRTSG